MIEVATIDRVEDLRGVWPNEARDFTPWLAENITVLGEALGMDLEVEEREASVGVGGYKLDVLARDLGSDRKVVIENQLGPTDHSHLGQLLTYTAGFDANVIVWIAKKFQDDHREALDLLNRRTGEDSEFFGIEVELWKIDDSRPAVNFKLVATPNQWRKQTVSSARAGGGVSERDERYLTFFQVLVDTMREEHNFTKARKARPRGFYAFSSGRAHVKYGASFASNGRARIEVYIDNNEDQDWNKDLFDGLSKHRSDVEFELGGALEWERLDHRRASRISAVRQGSIDDDEATLDEIREWMVDRLLKFKQVFGPRLEDLVGQPEEA